MLVTLVQEDDFVTISDPGVLLAVVVQEVVVVLHLDLLYYLKKSPILPGTKSG
jgi:hypothetical protein